MICCKCGKEMDLVSASDVGNVHQCNCGMRATNTCGKIIFKKVPIMIECPVCKGTGKVPKSDTEGEINPSE